MFFSESHWPIAHTPLSPSWQRLCVSPAAPSVPPVPRVPQIALIARFFSRLFQGKSTGNYGFFPWNYGFLMRMFLDLFLSRVGKLPMDYHRKVWEKYGKIWDNKTCFGHHRKYAKFLPFLMTAMQKKTILTKTWCFIAKTMTMLRKLVPRSVSCAFQT